MRWEKVSRCRCVIIWSREKEGWNKESCINIWQFHFFFLLLPRHLQVAQLAWASEPIVFGSAFVSIYGKASSCALFLTIRNLENFKHSQDIATIDAHVVFVHDSKHRKADCPNSLPWCAIDDYINSTAWVLRCLFNIVGYTRTSDRGTGKCQVPRFFRL